MDPFIQHIANNVINNGRLLEMIMQPSGNTATERFSVGFASRGGFQPSGRQHFVPRAGIPRPRFGVPFRTVSYARTSQFQQPVSQSSQLLRYPVYNNAYQPRPRSSSSISSPLEQAYHVYPHSRSQRRRERKRANERAAQQYAQDITVLLSNSGLPLPPNIASSQFFNNYLATEHSSEAPATGNVEAHDDSVGMNAVDPLAPSTQ